MRLALTWIPTIVSRALAYNCAAPLIRSILDGFSPPHAHVECCVLRVSPEHHWQRSLCTTCRKMYVLRKHLCEANKYPRVCSLPLSFAFCTSCADEDGKCLDTVLHLILHVCDVCDAPTTRRSARHVDTLPIVATGQAAERYVGCSIQQYASDESARKTAHQRVLRHTTNPISHVLSLRIELQHDLYVLVHSGGCH